LTVTTRRRRSRRSAQAPLSSAKSSQGSCWAKTAPATAAGSVVIEATSSGPAAMVTPSPMLETALAVQSLLKSAPRRGKRARKIAPRDKG
jgi:hypothetical protein